MLASSSTSEVTLPSSESSLSPTSSATASSTCRAVSRVSMVTRRLRVDSALFSEKTDSVSSSTRRVVAV